MDPVYALARGVLHIVDPNDDKGIVGLTGALHKADLRFSHSETENSNSTYVLIRWRSMTIGGRWIQS